MVRYSLHSWVNVSLELCFGCLVMFKSAVNVYCISFRTSCKAVVVFRLTLSILLLFLSWLDFACLGCDHVLSDTFRIHCFGVIERLDPRGYIMWTDVLYLLKDGYTRRSETKQRKGTWSTFIPRGTVSKEQRKKRKRDDQIFLEGGIGDSLGGGI